MASGAAGALEQRLAVVHGRVVAAAPGGNAQRARVQHDVSE